MKSIITCLFILFASFMIAQDVESELGFVFMKAEYLLETQRYGEAIDEYSKVISQDPTYKDAYSKRAEAKYALKSYTGVRNDIIELIKVKGVSAQSVRLLGLAESQLGNHTEAVNSLILAQSLFPKDSEIVTALAMSAYSANDPAACKILKSQSGNNTVAKYIANVCNSSETPKRRGNNKQPKSDYPKQPTSEKGTKGSKGRVDDILTVDPSNAQQEESQTTQTDKEVEEVVEEEVVIDDTVNRIVIDEDLTVIIKNGIGSRRIIDQPSILLLSEKSGEVTVDICVSKAGRVESAKINEAQTSINTESLKSLALRKAKEFWFGRGDEQCGTIVLEINGGS